MTVTSDVVTASPAPRDPAAASTAKPHTLYLKGRPTLKRFVRHVRRNAARPPSEGDLVAEWHAARRVVQDLEREEAGAADGASITKLGAEYTALLTELLRDPLIKHGFNTVPTEVATIDLERLVVYQKHIDLAFAAELDGRLPPAPSDADVFKLCLPFDHAQPPVTWSRLSDGRYTFLSPSNGLRYLGVMPLDPEDVDYPPPGSLVAVIGVAVGFGSNFLNAVCAEGRVVLRNGSHRAYALYKRGIRRAPCIIQHVEARDELELVGSSELVHEPDLYLRHPRPPMLRDYFNPALHTVMRARRRLRQVTVDFRVDEELIPEL